MVPLFPKVLFAKFSVGKGVDMDHDVIFSFSRVCALKLGRGCIVLHLNPMGFFPLSQRKSDMVFVKQ